MALEITFTFKSSGRGTTLTHAAIQDSDTTLCDIPITPEWIYDGEWADGPECKRCRTVVAEMNRPEFPVYYDAQGREHQEF